MVKNVQGGSNNKKFARKHTSSGSGKSNNKLRVSEDECEIYAIVTKLLGNGMFHCYCVDGIARIGHIRGKFSGRHKRDNIIEGGKWVLIGLREWDSASTTDPKKSKIKLQQCDLLEVYTDLDKHRLRETISANWKSLDDNDVSKIVSGENKYENDIIFSTEDSMERDRLIQEMKSTTTEKIVMKTTTEETVNNEDEEIYFDDI